MPHLPAPARKRRFRRTLGFVCATLAAVFLLMVPPSFRSYTTLGIDSEQWERPGQVYVRYCRLRWPGDGSVRIGGGGTHYGQGPGGRPLQIFDLGGRFFQRPRRDTPGSLWNRLGFWWIVRGVGEPPPASAWQVWAGVPSVLPPVLLAAIALLCIRKSKATEKSGAATAAGDGDRKRSQANQDKPDA